VLAGDEATEAAEDGPTEDDVDSAQASNERQPGAFEMTAPRAGGAVDGEGVAGPDEGDGNSRRAARRTRGQGGTRADVPEGHGQPATRARDQDPYLRKLNAKVLSRVRFPPKLALEFEQGEVTVRFILRRDGTVSDVKVSRSSGFREFDAALVDAIRDAAPFGPVPAALVGGRSSVPVSTPFSFENPLIR
jgi:protein TonB